MSDLSKGDKVTWNSSGGESEGTVSKKIISDKTIAGHIAKASPDNPQYEVKSDKSGKSAIHKPESLSSN